MTAPRGAPAAVHAPRVAAGSGARPLFVYGTLMQAGAAAGLLGARRRGAGTTRGDLFHLVAGYPALDPAGHGTVHGEWVDPVSDAQLSVLDAYEGVPEGLFRRALVEVHAEGLMFEAWSWVMDDPASRGGVRVPSGRWRAVSRR